MIAFTTGEKSIEEFIEEAPTPLRVSDEGFLDPLYKAVVESTEEAIINALFKAETMIGINGNIVYELPLYQVENIFKKYGRTI